MPADSCRKLKQELVRVIKIPLVAVDELGKQENCQCRRNIIDYKCILVNAGANQPGNLLRGDESQIDNGVDDFKKIIAKKEIPGKRLPFADADKQIDAEERIEKNQHLCRSALVNLPHERKRISISRNGEEKEEEVESGQ